MSGLFSSGPEEQGEALPAFDDTVTPRSSRRVLLAGVATLAVLAGGCGGLFWLAGTPAADASAAAPQTVPATAGDPDPSATVTTSAAVALNGREIVATPESDGGAGSSPETAVTSATAVSTGVAGGTSSISTSRSTTSSKPTTPPKAATPAHTTAPTGSSTPSPSRSTTPAWVAAEVRFVAGDATSATFELGGLTAGGTKPEEQRGVVAVGYGQLVGPLSVRYYGVTTGGSAILLSDADRGTGWLVPAKTVLPDAVVGVTKGRVRAYGLAGSADDGNTWWVRVDRLERVAVKEGVAVDGTGLSLTGKKNDDFATIDASLRTSMANTDPVFFASGSVTYFGRFGGGETDGVAF